MDFERLKAFCYGLHEELVCLSSEIESLPATQCEAEIMEMLQSAAAQFVVQKRQLRDQLRHQCEASVNEILRKSQLISVRVNFDCGKPDVSCSSIESAASVVKPPYKPLLNKLMLDLEQLNTKVSQRSQRENKLRLLARDLSAKLDMPEPIPPNSLSEPDLSDYENRVSQLQSELKDREEKVSHYLELLQFHAVFIGERDHPDLERFSMEKISTLNNKFMEELRGASEKFEAAFLERESRVKGLESRIQSLAEALDTSADLPPTAEGAGSERRIEMLEHRLAELNLLKLQKIDLFIENSRRKLRTLWDQLFLDEARRRLLDDEEPSEALLGAVEAEVRRLEGLIEDPERKPIISCLSKCQQIYANEAKLAEMSSDPGRLARRGFAASLKQEEKLRRWNSRHKPEVFSLLNELIKKWASSHPDETFYINGKPLPELLAQENSSISSSQRRQSLTRKRVSSAEPANAREKRFKSGETTSKPYLSQAASIPMLRPTKAEPRNLRPNPPRPTRGRIPIAPRRGGSNHPSDASKQRAGAVAAPRRPLTALAPSRLNMPSSTPGKPNNISRKSTIIPSSLQTRSRPVHEGASHGRPAAVQPPSWESEELRRMQDMEISYFDETSIRQPSFDYERDAF